MNISTNSYVSAHTTRGLFYFIAGVMVFAPLTGFLRSSVLLSVFGCVITTVFVGCLILCRGTVDIKRDLPALLFVGVCWLTSVSQHANPDVSAALVSLLSAFELGYLTRYLTPVDRARLVDVVVGTAVIVTVMLTAGKLFPGRLAEMVVNVNICAGYILFGFVLSVAQAQKKVYLFLSVLMLAGIVVAGSRAAMLAGVLAAGLYWWRDMPRPARWVFSATVTAGFLLMLNGIGSDVSLLNRLSWWQAGWRMFMDHPLLGAGWGTFGSEYLVYRPVVTENTAYAHNIVVQLLAEGGVAGAGLWGLFIVSRWAGTGRISPVTAAAGAFLMFNLFDYGFFVPALQFTFFVVMFIMHAGCAERAYVLPLLARVGIAGLAVACCLVSMPPPGPSAADYAKRSEAAFSQYVRARDSVFLARAIEQQQSAVRAAPHTAVYRADLAWLYRTSGQETDAWREMLAALRRDPLNVRFQRAVRSLIPRR